MESEWRKRLNEVDDDYLTGISNKGIVKRAYKDLEAQGTQIVLTKEATEAIGVSVGSESVEIRYPLGECTCSCPSHGTCRHIVTAVLALKEQCREMGNEPPTQQVEEMQDADGHAKIVSAVSDKKATENENTAEEVQRDRAVWDEILAVPFDKLKRMLGKRRLQKFASPAFLDTMPEIERTSVVTVRLQGGETVKLLSPLAYATCTCHKKELCSHKAEAILWCQIKQGKLSKEELSVLLREESPLNEHEVRTAANQMMLVLSELLGTGLARISPEAVDKLERMALVAHNAQLANFEGYFRALARTYEGYLSRRSSFSMLSLMQQISRLYERAEMLLYAPDKAQMAQYAGTFRAEYQQSGTLLLTGITLEQFRSNSGYEGYTVYFLDQAAGKWYTYTDARPVYYEGGGRREDAQNERAPWNLNMPLGKLSEFRLELHEAKVDQRGRLSASKETTGLVVGERRLCTQELRGLYYRDWKTFYFEQIAGSGRAWLSETEDQETLQLFFLQPASLGEAYFSETQQLFVLALHDGEEREVFVEVKYSNKDAETIRYLEKMTGRVQEGKESVPCFLGKVYLREGRLRMYPIALFGDIAETCG